MIAPLLASLAFGFVKGFTSSDRFQGLDLERDLVGPAKEEVIFRGPLWLFPKLPQGSTAIVFAAEHIAVDVKREPTMTPLEVLARLGDVFLGGYLYELAFRKSGILGAIASHSGHNAAIGAGQLLRNGRAPRLPEEET